MENQNNNQCNKCGRTSDVVDMSKCPFCDIKQATVPNEAKLTYLCGYEKGNGHSVSCPLYQTPPDPFGDFLKSQGHTVIDVTPKETPAPSHTEGEEWEMKLQEVWRTFSNNNSALSYETIKDFIRQEKKASYDEGFDAGGQTKGGTGRIMYMIGMKDGRQEIKDKIKEMIKEVNKEYLVSDKHTPEEITNEVNICRGKIIALTDLLTALTKLDETNV